MSVDLAYLKEQRSSFEKDLELCKAQAHKLLGAIELTNHLIADMEQEASAAPVPVAEAVAE